MKIFDRIFPDSHYINPVYLGISRIIYGLIVIVFADLPAYSWIGQEDLSGFFTPPPISIARLFSDFPGLLFFRLLTLANLILFFLMFLGIWCRWTSLLFSLTCIAGHTFWYSFGKVDHSLLWLITPIFAGFAGWGEYFSVRELQKGNHRNIDSVSQEQNSFWITMLALSVGFAMFTSGVAKVRGGRLNWETEAVRFHLIGNFFAHNKPEPLAAFLLQIDNHLLWKSMDYSTLVLEIGFLLSVMRHKIFSFYVAAAVLFHFVVLLMFNIFFSSNLITYVIFINWKLVDNRLEISKIVNNSGKYYKVVRILTVFEIAVFLYWLYRFFTVPYDLRFPGLLQKCLDILGIENSRIIALNCFFAGSMLVLVYAIIEFVKEKTAAIDDPVRKRSLESMSK